MTSFAEKQLQRLPRHIREHAHSWAMAVEEGGIWQTRKLPGYHDEPLKGSRIGQRSVRLNRAYRLIYEESESGELMVIAVIEVNKHGY